jgi:hypothetical protein
MDGKTIKSCTQIFFDYINCLKKILGEPALEVGLQNICSVEREKVNFPKPAHNHAKSQTKMVGVVENWGVTRL